MTILNPDEVQRLDELREHIRQDVVPGHASAVFLMTVIDRQAAALNMLRPAPEPKILTEGPDGFLHCPKCDGVEFKENGSHPCDWSFHSQETVTKTLVLNGEFEWYDGTDLGFECEGCGLSGATLPEGWQAEYA